MAKSNNYFSRALILHKSIPVYQDVVKDKEWAKSELPHLPPKFLACSFSDLLSFSKTHEKTVNMNSEERLKKRYELHSVEEPPAESFNPISSPIINKPTPVSPAIQSCYPYSLYPNNNIPSDSCISIIGFNGSIYDTEIRTQNKTNNMNKYHIDMWLIDHELPFIQNKYNDPSLIDLSHFTIKDEHLHEILKLFSQNQELIQLDLSSNQLGQINIPTLVYDINMCKYLKKLNLNNNHIGNNMGLQLTEVLKTNKSIKELYLASNELSDDFGINLWESISSNYSLSILDLSNNSIGYKGIRGIGEYFQKNGGSLRSLNLSANIIGDKGAESLLNSLQDSFALEELYISYNSLNNDVGKLLGQVIGSNTILLILDASYNQFKYRSAIEIGKGIAKNFVLKTLRLSFNPFTVRGCLYHFYFFELNFK